MQIGKGKIEKLWNRKSGKPENGGKENQENVEMENRNPENMGIKNWKMGEWWNVGSGNKKSESYEKLRFRKCGNGNMGNIKF